MAIHCKGGKGRTGLICSCLLLRMAYRSDARSALQLFAQKRTNQQLLKEIEMEEKGENEQQGKGKGKKKSGPKVQAVSGRYFC